MERGKCEENKQQLMKESTTSSVRHGVGSVMVALAHWHLELFKWKNCTKHKLSFSADYSYITLNTSG